MATGEPAISGPRGDEGQEEAYTRAINTRAHRIVEAIELTDEVKTTRVEQIIVSQYRRLRDVHDARDAEINVLDNDSNGAQSASIEIAAEQSRQRAQLQLFKLHRAFIATLAAELTPDQLAGVKDGMTYGVMPRTYARYLELLPDLSEAERNDIRAMLWEAREYAMDAGTSEEKHGWFRKYKGRINNYLSAAGYDIQKAEKRLQQR